MAEPHPQNTAESAKKQRVRREQRMEKPVLEDRGSPIWKLCKVVSPIIQDRLTWIQDLGGWNHGEASINMSLGIS
jgi:hypothetical protein